MHSQQLLQMHDSVAWNQRVCEEMCEQKLLVGVSTCAEVEEDELLMLLLNSHLLAYLSHFLLSVLGVVVSVVSSSADSVVQSDTERKLQHVYKVHQNSSLVDMYTTRYP